MASPTLYRRAAERLEQTNRALRNMRERNKTEMAQVRSGVGVLAGAAAAALIDEKWGEGQTAKVAGVPVAAGVGALLVGSAVAFDLPYRQELGAGGLGMLSVSLYQYIRDSIEFEEE
jgi:hypothetical protein